MTPIRYLPLYVYRAATFPDASNDGVSSRASELYIAHPEGFLTNVPALAIFTPEQRRPHYWALIPANPRGAAARCVGPMDGGNLAYSPDSRAGGIAYHVHDRYETQEENDALSR